MKIDLGKVAVTAGGYWKNNKSYEALTLVVYKASEGGDGCGYIALKNNIGVAPGTDETVWMIATQAGQSIYDLAVARGYEGTEDDFVAEYNAAVAAANNAAGTANAAAEYARETANAAAEHAEEAAETTKQMNAGLIGLKVEDGELILVQNAETGTVTGGEIDGDGMVTLEFEV